MNLKKKLFLFAAVIVLVLSAGLFAACSVENPPESAFEDSVTIVVQGKTVITSYDIDLSDAGFTTSSTVLDVMIFLAANTAFSYNGSNSFYGFQLFSVGHIAPAADNEFIAVFTSIEKDFLLSDEYAKTIDYKGVSLTTAGLGVAQLSIEKDAVILFRIETAD